MLMSTIFEYLIIITILMIEHIKWSNSGSNNNQL